MSKGIENKFNKLIDKSDPQSVKENLVDYTIEAMDDVLLNKNKNNGLEKMETSVKFFQDYQHKHPINFRKASNKIIAHLVEILSKEWEDAVLSNYELRLFINLIAIVDLFFLNFITELLTDGKDEKSLKYAQDCINELRTMKIEILDNELFPKALTELKNRSHDLPGYDESIHEEFVNEVKKEIQDYDSKSD